MKFLSALAAALWAQASSAAWVNPRYQISVASGWTLYGVTSSVLRPRGMAWDSAGHLVIVQQAIGIVGLTLNADGSVASQTTISTSTFLNHGITFSVDGRTLYASSNDTAWAWDYNPSTMAITNQRVIVRGMNNADHVSRTLLISTAHPNLLLVSRGSNDNLDMATVDPAQGRSTVKAYDLNAVPSGGYNHASQGYVLAYGVRNEVGIAEDKAGIVWGVENSADNIMRNGRDVHQDNPGEKLHRFGDAAALASVPNSSKDYGYPYCFAVWQPSLFTGESLRTGDWFVQSPSSTRNDTVCNNTAQKAKVLFPAHTAPLDIKFPPNNDNNVYVSLHGSWNRQPPIGYSVIAVPGSTAGNGEWSPTAPITSMNGFTNVMWAPNLGSCPNSCFRPVGLAFSPDGSRLYVSSDTSSEIVMLQRQVQQTSTTTTTTTTSRSTTTTTTTTSRSTTTTTTTTSNPGGCTVAKYGQCGGNGYNGCTTCAAGSTCQKLNDWYFQCL